MRPNKAKVIAAVLLKCGKSKIWIDPTQLEKVGEAITKEDVRGLIAQGVIKRSKEDRLTTGKVHGKRKKKGPGKKRGTAKARIKPKRRWIANVRAQRKKLREIRDSGVELKVTYRKAYSMIKGGFFKGKKYLESYVSGAKK